MSLHRSHIIQHKTATGIGKVILAAAGPGDPDLITIKAAAALKQAEVVLVDRLVSEVILHRYVPATAEIIEVGKECSKKRSTPQAAINELLVYYALQGKKVVRLKGGDVCIFSNILDELKILTENKIPYEIIPGVTAALGAAAYSGIPLTARGFATAVRFLTYYKSDIVTDDYWKELATTADTLVLYMSSGALENVVNKLIAFGAPANKQLAIIEQATTSFQNVHTCTLNGYYKTFKEASFASPSIVIIGAVVALHEQFKWLANNNSKQLYFKPVTEALTNSIQKQNNLRHAI